MSNYYGEQADYDLEEDFPNLRASGWDKKSERTPAYNCIGYAAGDTRYWDTAKGYYWPPGALREYSVFGWASAFRLLNYRPCDSRELEAGIEKIAIYEHAGKPTHVARQLESGEWTSKLGPDEDIHHNTLQALEGDPPAYGEVVHVMKRQRWFPKDDNETTQVALSI